MCVQARRLSMRGLLNKSQISDAIRRFGVSDKTTVLLVVKIHSGLQDDESKKSILAAMQAAVEGELISLSSLSDFTDWTAVKKVQLVSFTFVDISNMFLSRLVIQDGQRRCIPVCKDCRRPTYTHRPDCN